MDDKFGCKSTGLTDGGWDRRETRRVISYTFPFSRGPRLDLTEASRLCALGAVREARWAPFCVSDGTGRLPESRSPVQPAVGSGHQLQTNASAALTCSPWPLGWATS